MTRRCYLCDRAFERAVAQNSTGNVIPVVEEPGTPPICLICRCHLVTPEQKEP